VSSAIDLPQRLDTTVVNKLDETSSYLYSMLMNWLENEPLQIDFQDYVFRYRERVHLAIEDVMELLTKDMLNVSVFQILCM
jgi:hypothetical protein